MNLKKADSTDRRPACRRQVFKLISILIKKIRVNPSYLFDPRSILCLIELVDKKVLYETFLFIKGDNYLKKKEKTKKNI